MTDGHTISEADVESILARLRGPVHPEPHNARTISALTANPGCARRAVMDAAGVNKQHVAAAAGYPARFGQSQFAIVRGNAFEAQVKANGCAELLRLLRETLKLDIAEVAYTNLDDVGGETKREVRHAHTRHNIERAAEAGDDATTLFDHPLLRIKVGGRAAFLEPDLVTFQVAGRFHVVEIKSFPVIDGQADGGKVAAAVTQAAVYVIALRELLEELGHDPSTVADEVVLVCPENFANRPTAVLVDIRKQLTVLRRQLSRMARIETLLATLPRGLTFDLVPNRDGTPTRPASEIVAAIEAIPWRYAPECLDTCELAYFCREASRGDTAALGRDVRDELGGIESVAAVLDLAAGRTSPGDDQAEAADLLRTAARIRLECLRGAA